MPLLGRNLIEARNWSQLFDTTYIYIYIFSRCFLPLFFLVLSTGDGIYTRARKSKRGGGAARERERETSVELSMKFNLILIPTPRLLFLYFRAIILPARPLKRRTIPWRGDTTTRISDLSLSLSLSPTGH